MLTLNEQIFVGKPNQDKQEMKAETNRGQTESVLNFWSNSWIIIVTAAAP